MSDTAPTASSDGLLDPRRLDAPHGVRRSEPFAFIIAPGQLPPQAAAELARDFPRYPSAGFFPHDPAECGPSINDLVAQLSGPAFANAIGEQLGIVELARYPALVTLCRSLNARHGTIHTDSVSKVVTALLYLNESWPDTDAGCLRFLHRIDDIDALVVPQVRPLFGTLVAFRRADNSFHGHLPWQGERRVIQVAWLLDEREKSRKRRRGRLTRWFKRVLGGLDRRFGARRDRNAAHRD